MIWQPPERNPDPIDNHIDGFNTQNIELFRDAFGEPPL